jgi:hypothetical protein
MPKMCISSQSNMVCVILLEEKKREQKDSLKRKYDREVFTPLIPVEILSFTSEMCMLIMK